MLKTAMFVLEGFQGIVEVMVHSGRMGIVLWFDI
jgi:hypothetical protein